MRQDPIISGSILSADFASLGNDVNAALDAGVDWVHFDVMDQHFVPNLTFGAMVCDSLRQHGIKSFIDVHLMVESAENFIEPFAKAGANLITFHPETTHHVDRLIQQVKESGCEVGVALNPATPVHVLEHIIQKIDLILLMTVNPGFGGQSFINTVEPKIEAVRGIIDKSGSKARLQVDGGVNDSNIKRLYGLGVDTFVVGSHIFNSSDYKATVDKLKSELS